MMPYGRHFGATGCFFMMTGFGTGSGSMSANMTPSLEHAYPSDSSTIDADYFATHGIGAIVVTGEAQRGRRQRLVSRAGARRHLRRLSGCESHHPCHAWDRERSNHDRERDHSGFRNQMPRLAR